jgi:hypothetical protein
MTLHWGLSYKAFNLPSHPDHEYIWFKGGDLKLLKSSLQVGGGVCPRGLSYKAFNLPTELSPTLLGNLYNKCDRVPHPKPYIFMIRMTRQIKCIIAQAPGIALTKIILKICTFCIKKPMILQEKNNRLI